ncbi:MAG: tetratricopeptide repeat protein [Caldilineaceae bacterium]
MTIDSESANSESIYTPPLTTERQETRAIFPGIGNRLWGIHFPAICLTAIWVYVLIGMPGLSSQSPLQIQVASWLAFLALLIAPGYWLGEILWNRPDFDWLERWALAFSLGVVVMSVPGMGALLLHGTLDQLVLGWIATATLVLLIWLFTLWWRPKKTQLTNPWTLDQALLLLLIVGGLALALPLLTLEKIDGDAYAVGSFTADALAGLPLNASEPLFGTQFGSGVRMAFNQSLPLSYLWSYLSGIDGITMAAVASRSMMALWILLASYMLGKAVGDTQYREAQGRRFGLVVAAIQLLIYLAAPFLRDDNVSLFFFERTSADKFMVPTVMLPVAFALAIRYLAQGERRLWLITALICFAVSTIHPLIAAMLALALCAFAGFHWLLHFRQQVAFQRLLAFGVLAFIAMALPLIQLTLSRGDEPLAPSFPVSLDGWPVGYRQIPALPYFYLPSLDVYGPLPDFSQLQASDADSVTNPFLIGRFAVNMARRRLILFDLQHYISDPNLLLEPPYLLALLCLPFLLSKIRQNLGAQFAVSTSLAILFVMFNPYVTPIIGSLVMPWILWRFVWLLPYALIFALIFFKIADNFYRLRQSRSGQQLLTGTAGRWLPSAMVLGLSLFSIPMIRSNWQTIQDRATVPAFYPTPGRIFGELNKRLATESATVLADQEVSVTLAAYVGNAHIVAHRAPTISEIFPANQQKAALQRLIDQARFFQGHYLSQEDIAILQRYDVRYLIVTSGSSLDLHLRLSPQWFQWLLDDHSYTLYAVLQLPTQNDVIRGNDWANQRQWEQASAAYQQAFRRNPKDALALLGLAEIAHAQGRFGEAIAQMRKALAQSDQPVIHFELGQLYAELGQNKESLSEFRAALTNAPHVPRFHLAVGERCLQSDDTECAGEQFAAAVDNEQAVSSASTNQAERLIALADQWHQHGKLQQALPLYEEAVRQQPSQNYQILLANAYSESGAYSEAELILTELLRQHLLSVDIRTLLADVYAKAGEVEKAVDSYRTLIQLQEIQGQESNQARLALAKLFSENNQFDAAQAELATILQRQPNNSFAYALQGEIDLKTGQSQQATSALQQAFRLDPSNVGVYVALSNQLQQQGGSHEEMVALLQRAIQANPQQAILSLALGDQSESNGDLTAASNAFLTALDNFDAESNGIGVSPTNLRLSRAYTYGRMATVREKMGESDAALNFYNAAASAAPDTSWAQIMLGEALQRNGNFAAAQVAFERAQKAEPSGLDAYLHLADLATQQGQTEKAIAYRQQALATAQKTVASISGTQAPEAAFPPTNGGSQLTHSVPAAAQSDETRSASVTTSQADAGDPFLNQLLASGFFTPNKSETLNLARSLAQLYQEDGQPEAAQFLYRGLIENGNRQNWPPAILAQLYNILGDLYLEEHLSSEAAAAYQQALQLNPWWAQSHLSLARAEMDLQDSAAAVTEVRQATALAPGDIQAQVTLVDALLQQGNQTEAQQLLNDLTTRYPANPDVMLVGARLAQRQGNSETAIATYRKLFAANPNNVTPLLGIATILIDEQNYEGARKQLEHVLELDPTNTGALFQQGVIALKLGQMEQALNLYESATQQNGTNPQLIRLVLDQLEHSGSYTGTLQYIQDVRQQQQGKQSSGNEVKSSMIDLELTLRQARAERRSGKLQSALRTQLQAEQRGLHSGALAAELSELYFAQSRLPEAIQAQKRAIRLAPEEFAFVLRLSQMWLAQGNVEQALQVLKQGLSTVGQPAPLYTMLARLYLQLGQPEAAQDTLQQGLAALGEVPELLLVTGELKGLQNKAEAETWYEKSLTEHPDFAQLQTAFGDFLAQEAKLDQAIERYQRAIQLEPQNAQWLVNLGRIYEQAKQPEKSFQLYQRAVELEPTVLDAYIWLARLAQEQKDWDTAQKWLDAAMRVAPAEGRLYVELAALRFNQGQKQEAEASLQQAVQVQSTATTLRARANLYLKLKRTDAARADFEAALALEPGSVETRLALAEIYLDSGRADLAQQQRDQAHQLAPGLVDEK